MTTHAEPGNYKELNQLSTHDSVEHSIYVIPTRIKLLIKHFFVKEQRNPSLHD